MRRSVVVVLLLLAPVLGAVLAAPSQACACGIALQADVTRERALVIQRGAGREEIVASFDLEVDDGGTAAVVLPVPGDPTVEAVDGDPLGYLDAATAPKPSGDETGAAGGAAAPGAGVDVIGRETVGGYDVSRLRADDPRALATWLQENGYTLPPDAGPILKQYVERGWRYVAIRLAEGEEGALKPLRVAFPSRQLVYPMRLSSLSERPVSVTLYVLAGAEQQVPILSTSFAEPVARLDPQPPPELGDLFEGGTFVTKFVAESVPPSEFRRDLVITPAPAAVRAPGIAGQGDGEGVAWWIVVGGLVVFGGAAVTAGLRPPRPRA
ncbi:hypothetical protein DSM112329_00690 [Paraconexibacter sp. AEG42_29]|uniref:DUF2330 domain-containing protein n=1 Tax=Paraconexibacter sp. AEG42_29 TaxID=2997339 RepID=A0AAU7AQM1_9ACTN